MRTNNPHIGRQSQPQLGTGSAAPRRGGAVIILSLAMLMSLLFLGLFFFSFVDDESRSADIYAKQSEPVQAVSNRHVLNHGLSQVTVGTNDSDPNEPYFAPYSALFGGRYSMLAHIIGPIGEHDWDRSFVSSGVPQQPSPAEDLDGDGYFDPWTPTDYDLFNGAGVRVFWQMPTGPFEVDTNNDGVGETTLDQLQIHAGPLADASSPSGTFDPTLARNIFDADAGYTYPDLNSLFLYHQTKVYEDDDYDGTLDPGEDRNGNGILDFYTAIKPSFEAPAVLNAMNASAPASPYANPSLVASLDAWRVLRPHTRHQVGPDFRYISPLAPPVMPPRPIGDFNPQYLLTAATIPTERMGVWNRLGTTDADTYDFHVDADGDGVNDAFLIDLDYPLIEFPDGRGAVPLYFWRIEDLDALVNLNTAGDMPLYRMAERTGATRANVLNALVADTRFITGGNYGQSPSEINPGIPLLSDPSDTDQFDTAALATASEQYNAFYAEQAGNSSPASARLNIANTELLWLMTGRHAYDASSGAPLPEEYDIAGRYGETLGLDAGGTLLAAAGNTGVDLGTNTANDDDSDGNRGRQPNGGMGFNNGQGYGEWFRVKSGPKVGQPQIRGGLAMPPAVHPLDGTGFGAWLTGTAGTDAGKRALRAQIGGADPNPSQWLRYAATATPLGTFPFWQYQGVAAAGSTPWYVGVSALQAASTLAGHDAFWDEPDELIVDDSDPTFLNPADQPFPASEMTGLWASNADWTRLNITSRLRELAPINFTINFLAQEIRRQFTTVSWDRPEFGVSANGLRTWERTGTVFPPAFGTVAATPPTYASGGIVGADPLRPELRRLLYVNFNAQRGNQHPQQRLELNGILSDDSLGGAGATSCFNKNGNPRYRPLVPHPVFTTADTAFTPQAMNHTNGAAVPSGHQFANIGTSKEVQEWWARYDRQRLARDIYTMLWMMGPPADLNGDGQVSDPSDNVMLNGYTPVGTWPDSDSDGVPDAVHEMAQFAVNVVDAMDHDSVITKFVYDGNLLDGWDANPTGVVYGVEAQALTFSEALWIHQAQLMDGGGSPFDHPATFHDDGVSGGQQFLYIELRNALPTQIKLSSDSYKIERHETGTLVAGCEITFDM
ncbi:MAG: hypothetical protein ACK5Q5_06115, partial [Planctomycetaceae bacterium]